jgi:hypothetical protein
MENEMRDYLLAIVLNFSIGIAAILAIIRFKNIIRNFYPFVFLLWLGVANEALSLILIYSSHSNTVTSNIFVFAEFVLILWQFYTWNGDGKRKYLITAFLGIGVWLADNCILNTLSQNNSLFRSFYSFIIILFSISEGTRIVLYEKGSLLKNAIFVICITFLFYYGCKSFVEMINAFHLGLTAQTLWNFWIMMYFVNAIANLLYAFAILCIPTKQEFILPY